MRRLLAVILVGLFARGALAARLPILAYHDLVEESAGDELAVTAAQFREQMDYLKQHGYQPISLQACRDAAHGRTKLPDKAVMLSFDDGLAGFSEIALPVLERYRFPAVLSVNTGWLMGEAVPDSYRGRLLSPEQLRLLSRNPAIEILSHSNRLHESLAADPQGSQGAAGISRRFQTPAGYESESDYRQRIRRDLRTSAERLATVTGRKPRGIAWPYGLYNTALAEEAAAQGMEAQLALDDRPADCLAYPRLSRVLLRRVRSLADFEAALRLDRPPTPIRIVELRLDDIASAPASEQDARLRQLTERVRLLRANLAIVHPFAADGSAAFFANPGMASRADILHRALHLLRATAAVHERLLSLPATIRSNDALTELARRHPYEGLVLTGVRDPQAATGLRVRFSRYQPQLRCGVENGGPTGECRDFRLLTVPGTPRSSPDLSASTGMDTYYVVRPQSGEGAKAVIERLRQLRRQGSVHFGVAADGLLQDPATVRRLAVEYAAFVPNGQRE